MQETEATIIISSKDYALPHVSSSVNLSSLTEESFLWRYLFLEHMLLVGSVACVVWNKIFNMVIWKNSSFLNRAVLPKLCLDPCFPECMRTKIAFQIYWIAPFCSISARNRRNNKAASLFFLKHQYYELFYSILTKYSPLYAFPSITISNPCFNAVFHLHWNLNVFLIVEIPVCSCMNS